MQRLAIFTHNTDDELELINRFTRRNLAKNEVYAFSVVLCDNDVDRDGPLRQVYHRLAGSAASEQQRDKFGGGQCLHTNSQRLLPRTVLRR